MQGHVRRRRPSRMLGVTLAVAATALAGPVSSAFAGTVSTFGGGPTFTANTGEVNAITVTATPTSVTFSDANPITLDSGATNCSGDGTGTVTCAPATGETYITGYGVFAGDGDDSITAAGPVAAGGGFFRGFGGSGLNGDAGNDTVTGSNENVPTPLGSGPGLTSGIESLDGGPGADTVSGRGGDDIGDGGRESTSGAGDDAGDRVDLGVGNDQSFLGGSGDNGDSYQGGPGIDYLSASGGGATENGPFAAYSVNLTSGAFARANYLPANATTAGFEDYNGNAIGGNTVTGTIGSNVISGDDGVDVVVPSLGSDQLDLRGGNDSADTRDGYADRVQCGSGADGVAADQFDELTDCESVTVTKARPAGADIAAPACKATKLKSKYTSKSFAKGISFTFACSEAATLTVQEYVSLKSTKSLATASKAGDLILAEKTIRPGALSQKITLKPNGKLAKRLPKKFNAKFRISAQDEFGNRSVVTKKTKVSTAKKKAKKKKKSKSKKRKKSKSKKK